MRYTLNLLIALLLIFITSISTARAQVEPRPIAVDSNQTVKFINGHIWTGKKFVERPLFVRNGYFVSQQAEVDTTIDLRGGYIIPPFGDAHTHNLGDGGISVEIADSLYIQNGIFYAADLTNPYSEITVEREWLGKKGMSIREWFKKPKTLDVAFALGGITCSGCWPTGGFMSNYSSVSAMLGDVVWFMDSMQELQKKWNEYITQDPDVVKVYLSHVEEILEKGWDWGFTPKVVRSIVERAHEAGKRVFAHVSTAEDVRLALNVGIDVLAHIPLGNDGILIGEAFPYILGPNSIQRIGENNMVVIPTALLLVEDLETFRTDTLQQVIALQRKQIRKLQKAGARIVLSGHSPGVSSLREAMYFHAYNFFNNQTLLNLWSKTTPQAIFPNGKIGKLIPDYEASFLSLSCNPIENFKCVKNIQYMVKQGYILSES